MVLESTIVCVDNSDYMRNGDFMPTRLQAQQDAVNLICHSKTRSNPENNVGLITIASLEVLATLTTDVGRILSKLHQVQPNGRSRFASAVRIAHLALKHRQGKNHKLRIVVFVGSPIEDEEKDLVKLAKKLKKEKVNVDVINFGEETENTDKLTAFINTINGKDGSSSHLVTVPPGPMLSDALVSSPIIMGEDGSGVVPSGMGGFDFGVDPNEDPELALALRVSMEENRARQEEEARKTTVESATEAGVLPPGDDTSDDNMLKQALEMSMQPEGGESGTSAEPAAKTSAAPAAQRDISMMTEEEQIAIALEMSLAPSEPAGRTEESMETDQAVEEAAAKEEGKEEAKEDEEEDYSEVMSDPDFLQSVLEGLPGVDPQNEDIRKAFDTLTQRDGSGAKKDDKKKDDKK